MYNKKDFVGLKRIMIAFILIFTCLHVNVYGQDVIDISLEQPGKLKKVLKQLGKKDPLTITHLKITGKMDDKDIEILNQMSNLVYFDASKIENRIDLSNFPKLEHISFPISSSLEGEILGNLKSIVIPNNRASFRVRFPSSRINYKSNFIDKVYIKGEKDKYISDYWKIELDSSLKKELSSWSSFGKYVSNNEERIKVDTLYLPNMNALYCDALEEFDPCYVVLQAENKIILNRWKQEDNQSSIDLQGISYIMPFAFNNISNLVKIECSESMEEIFDYSFYGCKNLRDVDLKNIKKIGRNIFEKTEINSIVFPETLEELNVCTFKNSLIEEVELSGQYPPSITGEGFWRNDIGGIKFQIPANTLSSYQIGDWKNLVLLEKGANSIFEITLETPGTMEKHLSDEIIANARTLIVKGILYDTDFDVLKKCKNIQILDLSHSFICKSPETMENEEAEQAFIRGMLGYVTKLTVEDSEKQYKEGRIDVGQHASTNLFAEAVKEALNKAGNETINSNPNCIIPKSGFRDWIFIKEIKLPLLLENVSGMSGCKFLEKVTIPHSAKRINNHTFANCKQLKEVNFPASLEYIGFEAFKGCTSLKIMDLSNTKIEKIESVFRDVELELFYAPKNLKEFVDIPKIETAYFYTREAPGYTNDIKELHIPKGSRAGWSKYSINVEKVIDDIQ